MQNYISYLSIDSIENIKKNYPNYPTNKLIYLLAIHLFLTLLNLIYPN